jgi:hypothetical protein
MRNTADVTGGKPFAALLQPISGVSAIHPLVAFYDIHGGKREVLFFYFVPDTTRDRKKSILKRTAICCLFLTYEILATERDMYSGKSDSVRMIAHP